jgi:FG-GAP repeat
MIMHIINIKKFITKDIESLGNDEVCRKNPAVPSFVSHWIHRHIGCGLVGIALLCSSIAAYVTYDHRVSKTILDKVKDRNLAETPTSSPTPPSTDWDINWFQLGNAILGEYSGDGAGTSITISRNGLSIAVGAPELNEGYYTGGWSFTYIYKYSDHAWLQVCEIPDAYSHDRSGQSVALDDSGSIVAIGSPFDTVAALVDPNITKHPGTVRIYKISVTNTEEPSDPVNWSQLGYNITGYIEDDEFGWTVDLSNDGNRIAIGARRGCYVQVFKYSSNDDDWYDLGNGIICSGYYNCEEPRLDITRISGDGNSVIIGEPGSMIKNKDLCQSRGRITIYRFNQTSWNQLGQAIIGDSCEDEFGYSVDISDDGNTIAACSPKDKLSRTSIQATDTHVNPSFGSCKVFKWNSSRNKWTLLGSKMNGTSLLDMYGSSVSLNADGHVIAIGAKGSNANGDDSGSVQILVYDSVTNSWNQVGDTIVGPYPFATSGKSVALSAKGDIVTIGATNDNLPGSVLQVRSARQIISNL